MTDHKILRQEIISKTIEYHQARFGQTRFVPGKTRVNYAGRVVDEKCSNSYLQHRCGYDAECYHRQNPLYFYRSYPW